MKFMMEKESFFFLICALEEISFEYVNPRKPENKLI